MKIAVISDIHDNKKKLSLVLKSIKENACEMIFALGDYTSLGSFKALNKSGLQLFAVFGNADKDFDRIETLARKSENITLRREMNRVQINDENFAITHYPEISEKLLKSGMYKAVFYGHTHKSAEKQEDETLVANPGAVKDGQFGIYDSQTNKFKIIKI